MSNIIFPKINKGGGWNKSGGGGLENFSKINKRGGDDYSVLESTLHSSVFVSLHRRKKFEAFLLRRRTNTQEYKGVRFARLNQQRLDQGQLKCQLITKNKDKNNQNKANI